jgi:hypothetical protein
MKAISYQIRNDETGRHLPDNLAEDSFEQNDLSVALPEKVRALDQRLSQLLESRQARMPRKNPDFDPNSHKLMNRQFTLNLALKERQALAASATK